jgi:ABC-type antimicrobial peptide transport system permease subunit
VSLDYDDSSFYLPEITPFREGSFIIIDSYDGLSYQDWAAINKRLLDEYGSQGLYRVYEYDFSEYTINEKAYLSVHFDDLDKLGDFETYVRETFNVKIDMTQINAKENFNAVSTMGNILSALIIVFAIICIILFIVNLLKSYFQKIKRNLGTFKAFGISNRDLISVYVLIMAGIVISAIVVSVSATWFVQGALHICGVLKDGVFDYLSLWSFKTVCSIFVIIVAAIFTVYIVMKDLLKATPGDLIYDRQ